MRRFIETPCPKTYDVIIVGGGITGAAVAYEAAARGLAVALVDKGDFGAATSAATSKLIHGGLRYLANAEFGLVRESLQERRILENIAPNLVHPLPFLIPLYAKDTRRSPWVMEPGMLLYDLLSYDKGFTWDRAKRLPAHRFLTRAQTVAAEPIIQPAGLLGAIRFYDCASFAPERLTLAFVKSAVRYGADAANYARVETFLHAAGQVAGVVVRDLLHGRTLELRGRLTVNCAGPWADLVLDAARATLGTQHIRRSEGIHLVTRRLTRDHCVSGLSPAGQAFNLIPWRGHTLIGTTDREYTGGPDDYCVTREKIEALLTDVNAALGADAALRYADVQFAYGGLRPLVDAQSRDTRRASRRYEIYDNAADGLPGLITVVGGKYTTSRNLAANVLKLVLKQRGQAWTPATTARTYLAGCEIPDLAAFIAAAQASYPDFSPRTVVYLAQLYGTELSQVMDLARGDPATAVALNAEGEMPAQVLYAIRQEMARTLPDLLFRRTGLGTLGHPGVQPLELIAQTAARELNWSQARLDHELETAARALSVPA